MGGFENRGGGGGRGISADDNTGYEEYLKNLLNRIPQSETILITDQDGVDMFCVIKKDLNEADAKQVRLVGMNSVLSGIASTAAEQLTKLQMGKCDSLSLFM